MLGESPLFAEKIPIAKPEVPSRNELEKGLSQILGNGILTNGPFTKAFESAIAEHLKVNHAVAVSSATTGLMLAYRALNLTGEVIVPSFTFMATVSSLVWAGVRPIFADIDYSTGNLDPAAAAAAITSRTSAIVAVHNSGNPAPIDELEELAKRRNLALVFDAAHAAGSFYKGEPVGGQGSVQVFSLTPTKLLVAGEGGIITTNDEQLAGRLRILREYGNRGDYNSEMAGLNGRIPEFNALMGIHSLAKLESAVHHRNHLARLFRERLGRLPGLGFQSVREGDRNSYKDFSVIIEPHAFGLTRDELRAVLEAENIDTRTYYDPPPHRHIAYKEFASPDGILPNTDRLSAQILNVPIWSHMEESIASRICLAIEKAYEQAPSIRSTLAGRCSVGA